MFQIDPLGTYMVVCTEDALLKIGMADKKVHKLFDGSTEGCCWVKGRCFFYSNEKLHEVQVDTG
jgi:hypothetical protein